MSPRVYNPIKDGEESQGESASAGVAGSLGQRPKSSSGNFTNIQNYRQANQQGAQGLAQGVTGKIGQVVQQGQKELEDQKNEFQGQLSAEETRLGGLKTAVENSKNTLIQGGDDFNQGIDAIRHGMNASFQGPHGLRNFGLIQEQAKNTQQLGQATQNDAGRLALLDRFYGKPDYLTGQKRLDTLLLGGQAQGLKQARQTSQQLGVQLPTVQQTVQERIKGFTDPNSGLVGKTQQDVKALASAATEERLKRQEQAVQDLINQQRNQRELEFAKAQAVSGDFGNISFTSSPTARFKGDGTLEGFNFNFDPDTLRRLGAYQYQGNVDLDQQYTPEQLRGMIGRLSRQDVEQTNVLRGLLGQEAIQPQEAIRGSMVTDSNRIAELKDALMREIQQDPHSTTLDYYQDLAAGRQKGPSGFVRAKDPKTGKWLNKQQYATQNADFFRDKVQRDAMNRLLQRYGVSPSYRLGVE